MDRLSLIVRNRDRVLFDGEIQALTSYSEKGVFDILPEHANFIGIIKDGLVIHKLDGSTQEVKLTQGVVRVALNRVSVYLGILRG